MTIGDRIKEMRQAQDNLRAAEARIDMMMRLHQSEHRRTLLFSALSIVNDALGADWFVNELTGDDGEAYCALVCIPRHGGVAYAGRIPPDADGWGPTMGIAIARAVLSAEQTETQAGTPAREHLERE